MLQGEHSAILLTVIKLPFVIKIFVLSIFECLFYTGFTVVFSNGLGQLYFRVPGEEMDTLVHYDSSESKVSDNSQDRKCSGSVGECA